MNLHGTLTNCDEALRRIEAIADPVTRNLVNMAFTHFVKETHLHRHRVPQTDVDMLFVVSCLSDFFAEHDVLGRTLQGEKVGAWFDDAAENEQVRPNRAILLKD